MFSHEIKYPSLFVFFGQWRQCLPITNEFWEMIVFKNLKLLVMRIFWSLLSCRLSSENLTVVVMSAAGNQLFCFLSLSVFITVNAWRLFCRKNFSVFHRKNNSVRVWSYMRLNVRISVCWNYTRYNRFKHWYLLYFINTDIRNNMHWTSWLFWRAPHAALNLTVTIKMLLFRVQRESLCWGEMRAAWQQPCTQTPARYYSTHPPSTNRC